MIAFNRHIFPNGLVLLHHADKTTPFTVVNLLYKVGSRDEDPEHTGFAHLFEHLMFEGTKQVPEYDQPLQEAGGTNNAFTSSDYTDYYVKLPRENLELALFLEADRMQALDINEKSLATQKKVVIEEFKENYTNKPYGDVWHLLREMVYEKHPYRWPVIGLDYGHIRKASLKTVLDFYHAHYHPANAILCLAGNLDFDEATALAGRYFGEIPARESAWPRQYDEPGQTAEKRITVHRDIPVDAIYMVFKMPGRNHPAYYPGDLLSDLLATGKSSRLPEHLVRQRGLFTSIDAYVSGTLDTGMFVVEGKLRDGVTPLEGEQAIREELERIAGEGPGAEELDKVKNKFVTSLNFSKSDLMNRAVSLCYHEMLGDADGINREEAEYLAVNATDISAFARDYLTRERSNVLYYLKKEAP